LKTYRFKTAHRINLFNVSILNASNRVATRSGVGAHVGVAVTEACYVIWFGTHKEYDKINVETVPFDTAILNYKKL
jgi:mRNA interferase HigB